MFNIDVIIYHRLNVSVGFAGLLAKEAQASVLKRRFIPLDHSEQPDN